MNELILIGSLGVILAVLLLIKLKRPKRQKRWMPDIRRVVS
jgi:hypothetical protein